MALTDLAAALAEFPFAYLVTVADDGRPRVLAVDGRLVVDDAGRVARRPAVTLVFPPPTPDGMSLLVDGDATVDGAAVTVTPTWAVRHRAALSR